MFLRISRVIHGSLRLTKFDILLVVHFVEFISLIICCSYLEFFVEKVEKSHCLDVILFHHQPEVQELYERECSASV